MPTVTVWSSPNGLPIAITVSPTCSFEESPSGTTGRPRDRYGLSDSCGNSAGTDDDACHRGLEHALYKDTTSLDSEVDMQQVKTLHPGVLSFWHTMIGKKVVMASTGAVLVLFVIGHMLGNLKVFAGPEAIDAYARFLREAGWPELGYGQLLWLVRIVLLGCVTLHITAAVQLTRMSRPARPIGYPLKRAVGTTWAAGT